MENSTKQTRDAFNVYYTITGDAAYLDAEIARLRGDYPPAGYGTCVLIRDGGMARVRRSNSCD